MRKTHGTTSNPFLGGDVEVTEHEHHLVVGDLEVMCQQAEKMW